MIIRIRRNRALAVVLLAGLVAVSAGSANAGRSPGEAHKVVRDHRGTNTSVPNFDKNKVHSCVPNWGRCIKTRPYDTKGGPHGPTIRDHRG